MQIHLLLPHHTRRFGWAVLLPGIILGSLNMFFDWTPEVLNLRVPALVADQIFEPGRSWFRVISNNIIDELAAILIILGGLAVCFSKERYEDEYISSIRLNALMWAVYVHYALLTISLVLVYELSFFYIMIFNFFTLLFIFYSRFRWLLSRNSKSQDDE